MNNHARNVTCSITLRNPKQLGIPKIATRPYPARRNAFGMTRLASGIRCHADGRFDHSDVAVPAEEFDKMNRLNENASTGQPLLPAVGCSNMVESGR